MSVPSDALLYEQRSAEFADRQRLDSNSDRKQSRRMEEALVD